MYVGICLGVSGLVLIELGSCVCNSCCLIYTPSIYVKIDKACVHLGECSGLVLRQLDL